MYKTATSKCKGYNSTVRVQWQLLWLNIQLYVPLILRRGSRSACPLYAFRSCFLCNDEQWRVSRRIPTGQIYKAIQSGKFYAHIYTYSKKPGYRGNRIACSRTIFRYVEHHSYIWRIIGIANMFPFPIVSSFSSCKHSWSEIRNKYLVFECVWKWLNRCIPLT